MFIAVVAWTGITIMYCLHVAQRTSRLGAVLSYLCTLMLIEWIEHAKQWHL